MVRTCVSPSLIADNSSEMSYVDMRLLQFIITSEVPCCLFDRGCLTPKVLVCEKCHLLSIDSKAGQNGNKGDGLNDLVIRRQCIEHAEEALKLIATTIDGRGVLTDGENAAAQHTWNSRQTLYSRTPSCWAEFKNRILVIGLEKVRQGPHLRENSLYQERVQEE